MKILLIIIKLFQMKIKYNDFQKKENNIFMEKRKAFFIC